MKSGLTLIAYVCVALCLPGCGGAGGASTNGGGSPTPTFTGNWQITDNNLGGLLLAGAYLSEDSTSVSGVLAYQQEGNCIGGSFQSATITNGILINNDLTFNFAFPAGSGTLTGTVSSPPTSFTGSYTFGGSCLGGNTLPVTGTQVPSLAGNWAGIVTNGGVAPLQVDLFLTEGAVDSTGTPALTGTATITGTFPPNTTVETLPGNATGNQMGPFLAGPNGDATITIPNGRIMLAGFLQDSGGVAQPNIVNVTSFSFGGGTYNGASGWTGTLNRQ